MHHFVAGLRICTNKVLSQLMLADASVICQAALLPALSKSGTVIPSAAASPAPPLFLFESSQLLPLWGDLGGGPIHAQLSLGGSLFHGCSLSAWTPCQHHSPPQGPAAALGCPRCRCLWYLCVCTSLECLSHMCTAVFIHFVTLPSQKSSNWGIKKCGFSYATLNIMRLFTFYLFAR